MTKRLRALVQAEIARRAELARPADTPLSFLVAPDVAGTITDVGEAMTAAQMVRQDRKRTRVPISRSIADAVAAAARATNPRAGRLAAIMRMIVRPGERVAELTADEADRLARRIGARVAALRDASGAGQT